jgi:hypothetical protein
MKIIITENKLYNSIYKYIDNFYDTSKIGRFNPKTDDEIGEWGDKENPYITEFYYYEFDGDYDENGVAFIHIEKEYYDENRHSTMSFRNQSPILIVSDYGSFTDMFDDYWKKPMKQWFEDKYKLPVKTIVAD